MSLFITIKDVSDHFVDKIADMPNRRTTSSFLDTVGARWKSCHDGMVRAAVRQKKDQKSRQNRVE